MAEDRLKIWETLFQRALILIDSVGARGVELTDWSFGGGTVLMRRYNHRFSKDIDIFVPDRQWLGYLSPRLNETVEALTTDYVEDEPPSAFPHATLNTARCRPLGFAFTTTSRLARGHSKNA